MSSAALSYASGQPRRLSSKRRGVPASSASSLAADAAIRDFKDGRRRHQGDNDRREDGITAGVSEFASKASATVDSLGMPRWVFPALVLAGVGVVLAVAVVNTLPLLARHAVSGTATFNGKPLASVTVNFQKITGSAEADSRVIRTAADGSFQIAAGEGLPTGLYVVSVRPGESGRPIPPNYLSPETTPLRVEIREDLTGLQLSISDGKQRVRGSRR